MNIKTKLAKFSACKILKKETKYCHPGNIISRAKDYDDENVLVAMEKLKIVCESINLKR